MWEIACATTHPAAQSFPPDSTSMDALVVGLAPKKGASKKRKLVYLLSATHEACAQISTYVCAHKSKRLALHLPIEAYSFEDTETA